mgnify:CR=1 FL=1
MTTAALGGEIEVPSIDGTWVKLKIPEGTQSGTKLRLKNKGMYFSSSPDKRGDMYVNVVVETPVKLTKKQVELLRSFDEECTSASNPESESFFQKVKSFWDDIRSS